MKINIIGLGYIGLPTSLILAAKGNKVVGSDYNDRIINDLKHGKITFEEEGLVELYNEAVENGIEFSKAYSKDADMYIVTVPTPYDGLTKKIDPKYLISAVTEIINTTEKGSTLVIESTVSPGTIDTYIRPLLAEAKHKFDLVHAPERILPGAMITELISNPRTIGADTEEVGEKVKKIYESFCTAEIVVTSINIAEMSKVVENTFRDVNIAFANELAQICHEANLDVQEVIRIANKHPRVNILSPGPGVGGHCISVDPWFLVGDYPELTNLIQTARKTNDDMPRYILERIKDIMIENNISDYSKVGIYGITYKENVDDVRESPALQFKEILNENQSNIKFYDPFIDYKLFENQNYTFEEFQQDLELMVIFINHKELSEIKLNDNVIVFDTRNSVVKANKKYKI